MGQLSKKTAESVMFQLKINGGSQFSREIINMILEHESGNRNMTLRSDKITAMPYPSESDCLLVLEKGHFICRSQYGRTPLILTTSQTRFIMSKLENAARVAYNFARNGDTGFRGYADHRHLHTMEVMNKTTELLSNRPFDVGAEIERTVQMAALYHDTGMDNGERLYLGTKKITGFGRTTKECRQNHSLMSGLEALLHREDIKAEGLDPALIALLCASHSKSNSGLTAFDRDTFCSFIDIFNSFCDRYADEKLGDPIEFDEEYYKTLYGDGDTDWARQFRHACEILTLADAFAHASDTKDGRFNQLGEPIGYVTGNLTNGLFVPDGYRGPEDISPDCRVYFADDTGRRHFKPYMNDDLGRAFVSGESNTRYEEVRWSEKEKEYAFHCQNVGPCMDGCALAVTERLRELPRFNESCCHVKVTVYIDNPLLTGAFKEKLAKKLAKAPLPLNIECNEVLPENYNLHG